MGAGGLSDIRISDTKALKSDQETSVFVPEKSDANALQMKTPAGIQELLTKCLSIRPEGRQRTFHEVERLRKEVNLGTEDEDTLISSQPNQTIIAQPTAARTFNYS
jgi:hypothetical protein